MWSATHVQVVVQRAKGLLTKGKNKTNDCFVTIALGKEKYQTSVKEKAEENVEWHEECELQIPQQGNTAEIVLTALHRNFLGVDEFLGQARIPLSSFDIYELPKNRWYTLNGKPGKENTKERGKLEVKVGFTVKAGSLSDLSKKERHKSSLSQISSAAQSFGGSLLSIGSIEKRKGLKKLAKSIGNKVKGKSHSKNKLNDSFNESTLGEYRPRERSSIQVRGDADPGVVSDEEDEFAFENLSHKSSTSSLNSSAPITTWKSPEITPQTVQSHKTPSPSISIEMSDPISANNNKSISSNSTGPSTPPSKPPRFSTSSPNSKTENKVVVNNNEDDWAQKLYGSQITNSLKRWDNKRNSPKIIVDEHKDEFKGLERKISPKSSPIARLKGEIYNDIPIAVPRHFSLPREVNKVQISEKFQKDTEKFGKKDKKKDKTQKSSSERIIIGGEENRSENQNNNYQNSNRLPRELLDQFEGKSREDLIEQVLQLQLEVADKKRRLHDLEDYIDGLLLRVIECSPRLLQNPFQYSQRRLSSPGNQ